MTLNLERLKVPDQSAKGSETQLFLSLASRSKADQASHIQKTRCAFSEKSHMVETT